MQKKNKFIILLCSFGLTILVTFFLYAFQSKEEDYFFKFGKNLEIFSKILKEINNNYVDDVDPNQFVKVGIDEMLKTLDPYTNYYTASTIEDARIEQSSVYGDIGETLEIIDDKIVVTEVLQDLPAFTAGLKIGDEIIKIDEEVIKNKNYSIDDVQNLLKGQPNTMVSVTVNREGSSTPLSFVVTRTEIKPNNVSYKTIIEDDIAYIKFDVFTENGMNNIRSAYDELKGINPDLKGLILDLRDNPGGLLHEAVGICNLFVGPGEVITTTRGKLSNTNLEYKTKLPAMDMDIPLTVLVNGHSASASEIVSGVMQDLDRGVVLGQKSYGKGLVQNIRPLSYNSQMKVTISRYHTPSGRCIQAINYGKGKEKTPDSLQRKFKTRNGRIVLDAGGIDPDIAVDTIQFHDITKALLNQKIIFNYATKFFYKNAKIDSIDTFTITENIYNEFIQYANKHIKLEESKIDKTISRITDKLEEEAYYEKAKTYLEEFQQKVNEKKKDDIQTYKDEIIPLLKKEIISRYYHKKGVIEASFQEDKIIREAISVLRDKEIYNAILEGKI